MNQVQHVGIDVSAQSFHVALEPPGAPRRELTFCNTPEGHRQLIRRLTKHHRQARLCLESTGIYGLDLALALHRTPGIAVMILNPRIARRFAEVCLHRSKNDRLDAVVLLEYAKRMPFVPWQPPAPERLQLRALARRIKALVVARTQEKNRRHAAQSTAELELLLPSIHAHIRYLDRQIQKLETQALALIEADPQLHKALEQLLSVKGIGPASAVRILGELCVLPPDMTARQWVAHTGLDPRHYESGSSVHKKPRTAKAGNAYLKAALYMPARAAIRFQPHVRAFRDKLLAHGKTKMQAIVAVMRKLLHAIWGMFQHGTHFQGEKFYDPARQRA